MQLVGVNFSVYQLLLTSGPKSFLFVSNDERSRQIVTYILVPLNFIRSNFSVVSDRHFTNSLGGENSAPPSFLLNLPKRFPLKTRLTFSVAFKTQTSSQKSDFSPLSAHVTSFNTSINQSACIHDSKSVIFLLPSVHTLAQIH